MRWRGWLTLVCIGVIGFGVYWFSPRDDAAQAKGSPEYAARWRAAFGQFPDPETAQAAHPEVMAKRFPNGEWAFGVDRDSHKYPDGGPVVVKGSTGRVRAFFGHLEAGDTVAGFLEQFPTVCRAQVTGLLATRRA